MAREVAPLPPRPCMNWNGSPGGKQDILEGFNRSPLNLVPININMGQIVRDLWLGIVKCGKHFIQATFGEVI